MMRLATLTALALAAYAATPAHAQSPGDCACAVPAPVVVVNPARPRKLGVSLRLSSLSTHPESDPEAKSEFGGAGLAVSYRLTPRWGLAVAAEHFSEQLDDPNAVTRELQSATISATFHFHPRRLSRRWDLYLIGGIGVTTEVAPDDAKESIDYGTGHLGIGLERRFRRLGLSAEIRAIGMSEAAEEEMQPTTPDTRTGTPTALPPEMAEESGISGGQFSFAATYYF